MAWNSKLLECQVRLLAPGQLGLRRPLSLLSCFFYFLLNFLFNKIFLDVNCQDFNEEMWPSRLVRQALNLGKEEESTKIRKEQEEQFRHAKR